MNKKNHTVLEDKLHRLTSVYIQGQSTSEEKNLLLSKNRERLEGIVRNLLKKEEEILPQKTGGGNCTSSSKPHDRSWSDRTLSQ